MDLPDTMDDLLGGVREAEGSQKNRRNFRLWGQPQDVGQEHWHGLPQQDRPFPITVDPEGPMWADILDFSLKRFYTDPTEYLRRTLQKDLYRFRRWDANTCIERKVAIWLGVGFEPSLFGVEVTYQDRVSPWIAKRPVINSREDLDALEMPDFRSSGLMPLAHRFYEEMGELLPEDFSAEFPDWQRSPFGVCCHLRGMDNFLMDMVQEPEFARAQLRFVTECRKRWRQERARFLGEPLGSGVLYNDEVNGQVFPPRLYEDLVLPGETELGELAGIVYWHSCGDTTEFLELIRRIPGLQMFHVGPWTDVSRAAEVMEGMALQVCLNPVKDVQRADEEHIRARIENICDVCRGKPFTIRADGLHTIDTLARELQSIDRWLEIALNVREQRA